MSNHRLIILSCLIVIVCVISVLVVETYVSNNKKHIHIVIARYNEDLEWLCDDQIKNNITNANFKTSIYIYNKGDNNVSPKFMDCYNNIVDLHIIQLPNVGRCDHTYLHHIIENYNNLPDVAVFLPASCTMEYKFAKAKFVINTAYKDVDTVFVNDLSENIYETAKDFSLSSWTSSFEGNKINTDSSMELAQPRPYGEWYKHVFGDEMHHKSITYYGILAISREHIYNRNRDFYKTIITHVDKHHNPEAGHYIERSWSAIFKIPDDRKSTM